MFINLLHFGVEYYYLMGSPPDVLLVELVYEPLQ